MGVRFSLSRFCGGLVPASLRQLLLALSTTDRLFISEARLHFTKEDSQRLDGKLLWRGTLSTRFRVDSDTSSANVTRFGVAPGHTTDAFKCDPQLLDRGEDNKQEVRPDG